MSKINRSNKLLLIDMLDAIRAVEEFTADLAYDIFVADRKSKDAVVRNIRVKEMHLPPLKTDLELILAAL